MKLIINIPDNWEEELNQSKITFADIVDIDTIRNGIPLDKIRAEIEELDGKYVIGDYAIYYVRLWDVLLIIDKYKAESRWDLLF